MRLSHCKQAIYGLQQSPDPDNRPTAANAAGQTNLDKSDIEIIARAFPKGEALFLRGVAS